MVAMSFAVKELLVALKGFVSNFILAKSTPGVMKKEANRTIGSHHPTPRPLPYHKLYSLSILNLFQS